MPRSKISHLLGTLFNQNLDAALSGISLVGRVESNFKQMASFDRSRSDLAHNKFSCFEIYVCVFEVFACVQLSVV